MICSARLIRSWTAIVIVSASAVGAHAEGLGRGTVGSAVGDLGVVNGLSMAVDLDPLSDEQVRNTEVKPAAYSIDVQPRVSVPAVDRSRVFAVRDLFPNSKIVMPLLVSDMNPNEVSIDRPMSARSVGARPSLPFVRPMSRPTGR